MIIGITIMYLLFLYLILYAIYIYSGSLKQLYSIIISVHFRKDNPLDAGLNYQLSTLNTWCCCNVYSGSVAVIVGFGNFCYGVGFGMQNVGFCLAVLALANIFKTRWGTIISVRYNGVVFDKQGTYLTSLAI